MTMKMHEKQGKFIIISRLQIKTKQFCQVFSDRQARVDWPYPPPPLYGHSDIWPPVVCLSGHLDISASVCITMHADVCISIHASE